MMMFSILTSISLIGNIAILTYEICRKNEGIQSKSIYLCIPWFTFVIGLNIYIYLTDLYGLVKPFNGENTVETREGLTISYTLIIALWVPIMYNWMSDWITNRFNTQKKSKTIINELI